MKNTAFIILLTICFQLPVAGQLKVKQADAKFEKEFYYDAIETYLKVAEKQPAHTHVVTRLADSYRLVNNYPKAKEWYAKAVELPDVQPIAYFNYAEILKTMDMHEESFEWYEKYAATNPDDERVKTMLSDKDFLNTIDIKALYGELNKLDTKHKGSDFGATFMGENRIVFATTRNATSSIDHKNKRENQPFYDLWIADLNGWQPDSLRPMPEGINTPVHEGPAVFSKDGTEIFFTRNSAVQRDRFEQAVNHLMIYHSKFNGSTWSEPVPLPFNSDRYSCGHPALSPDGKILYFVSDIPGGSGQTDIYKSARNGNSWSKPENLGASINTPGKEMFPFVSSNGDLYFASKGHQSVGGLDIFSAAQSGNGFGNPLNLGQPVNSSADDFAFVLDKSGKNALFSSNRENPEQDDIYHFRILKRPTVYALEFTVKDKETNEPLKEVNATFLQSDKEALKTNRNGNISMDFTEPQKFLVRLQKDGYVADEKEITTRIRERGKTLEKEDLFLEKITRDLSFELEIFFDLGSADIQQESLEDLNEKALSFLQNNPSVKMEMAAHTDSRGNAEENRVLSQARAQSAVDYLVSKGVNPSRLVAKGYGESQLRNHCADGVNCSEEEHQKNRRVEIKVISF